MQKLSARNAGHEFTIDGAKFFLPPLSIQDVATVQGFAKLAPLEQATAMGDLLKSRATCPWWQFWVSPSKAVGGLGLKQQSELFTAWAAAGGISVGESSSSGS
jgi:hypothetical protein